MKTISCKHCNYYIGEVEAIVGEILCPNSSCKGTTQFKIVTNDIVKLVKFKFVNKEKEPRKKGSKTS